VHNFAPKDHAERRLSNNLFTADFAVVKYCFYSCPGVLATFRQIFFSRNGTLVNIAYHSRNADTAAVWQICSYY